jgi:hypothetical protein
MTNTTSLGSPVSLPYYTEVVDNNHDLKIHFYDESLFPLDNAEHEDLLRRVKGTIIDIKTDQVVHKGSFFPYEFTESEYNYCKQKMDKLNHKLEDMNIEYAYEGTIIRIFYHKKWYISTHRKLDSDKSKWGSNNSFKVLFEKGLEESYNISLYQLFTCLNLRCQYTFMIIADENTRFVCNPCYSKKVYLVDSDDPDVAHLKIDRLPKPIENFRTLDDVFNFIKGMKYPFTYQGLLLIHKNGSQYRIISDEYSKLFKVRNNVQSIPYRYIQLKTQNDHETIKLLKKLFPSYIPTFESYDKYITQLVDIIYHEYNKRKHRSLLPQDLTTVQQIDSKIYLFIKNKLLKASRDIPITQEKILELLWLEDPSNINHMIRMVKYNQRKNEEQKLIVNIENIDLNKTPDNPIPKMNNICNTPKKKKVRYVHVPVNFSCRRKLF